MHPVLQCLAFLAPLREWLIPRSYDSHKTHFGLRLAFSRAWQHIYWCMHKSDLCNALCTISIDQGSQYIWVQYCPRKFQFPTSSFIRYIFPKLINLASCGNLMTTYCQLSASQAGSSSDTFMINSPNNPLAHPNHALVQSFSFQELTLSCITTRRQ